MMTEWIELKDLQAVAKAQADGWEIEVFSFGTYGPWTQTHWANSAEYRGRPKAERKAVRVREAVVGRKGQEVIIAMTQQEADSYPKRNFVGWVKGSEWREVEYE